MKRGIPFIVTACALGLLVSVVNAQSPPTNLQEIGDHWTAWNPPMEFPEGTEVYVIEPGDTLWDLSTRFYADAYLWPQLWERNQYIEDAHWIYPGDPLVVSVEVTPIQELGDVDLGGEEVVGGGGSSLRLDKERITPHPLGAEDDIYCSGYIADEADDFGYRIIGSEAEVQPMTLAGMGTEKRLRALWGTVNTVKYGLSFGDIIYVDGGREAGLSAGQLFTVATPGRIVVNPHTGEEVGVYHAYGGRVRILSVQEGTAIAEIVQSCGPVHIGDGMNPFIPEPVPLGRKEGMRPLNVPSPASALVDAPVVLMAKDGNLSIAADHVVFINVGSNDGATPGDLYTIYRINAEGLPPVIIGELAVLSVQPSTSVAKVIDTRYAVYVGDYLELK